MSVNAQTAGPPALTEESGGQIQEEVSNSGDTCTRVNEEHLDPTPRLQFFISSTSPPALTPFLSFSCEPEKDREFQGSTKKPKGSQ